MNIFSQLSSVQMDRSEQPNRRVAEMCLKNPMLLAEIARGLDSQDGKLVADCAEVLTLVAMERPASVTPFAGDLCGLLTHPSTKVRWEAVHALALMTPTIPQTIPCLLPGMADLIHNDSSTIVRDYATDVISNYAATSPMAARLAYPLLKDALSAWDGKHALHALKGLRAVVQLAPELQRDLLGLVQPWTTDPRSSVSKAAKAIIKVIQA